MAVAVETEESLAAKFPVLLPHLDERQRRLYLGSEARSLGLPLDRVSVKFKTAEGVGPVGLGLSAEAQAIVTIAC